MRGVGENLLGLFRQRQLGGRGDPLDEHPLAFDLPANVLRLHLEAAEDLADRLLPFAQDSQQDVFGLDDPATQLTGFVAGEEERAAGFLVVLLKHWVRLSWHSTGAPQPSNTMSQNSGTPSSSYRSLPCRVSSRELTAWALTCASHKTSGPTTDGIRKSDAKIP
jgi:hypothetical protein